MKTIVILSTEPWGKMFLIKMHYAVALAEQGNQVYFVNPPAVSDTAVTNEGLHPNIRIIQLKEMKNRRFLIHKLFPVYEFLSRRYAKQIKKIIGKAIDELWCFNPHVFMDLKRFGASKTILFLYDFYKGKHIPKVAATADALVSVSKVILDYYKDTRPPKLLLQHGLGDSFGSLALKRINGKDFKVQQSSRIKFGYVGNLLRSAMDMEATKEIISGHEEIGFHFWGPWDFEQNNVSGKEIEEPNRVFIQYLREQPNVTLHGVKGQSELASEISGMDGYLFLYDHKKDMNGASNSHKLIEYLSTGKVVVSTFVSNYADTNLLVMTRPGEGGLPLLFDKVVAQLATYNSEALQEKRIRFALDNTYDNQIRRIETFVSGPHQTMTLKA